MAAKGAHRARTTGERRCLGVRRRRRIDTRARPVASTALAVLLLGLTLGAAAVDAALTRPVVFTGEASQLSTSSATLNGSLDPTNQASTYYFQYGTSTSYGMQTAPGAIGAGTTSIHVTAAIDGLAVGSVYHYRLLALNASGTAVGADRTFTTKSVPLTFTLSAPRREPFQTAFSVTGTLSGTASTGRPVVLQANPFPYLAGFATIAGPILTDSAGHFALPVAGLAVNTQLRVLTQEPPRAGSSVFIELVAVRVTLHVQRIARAGYVRFYGAIAPAEANALVVVQQLRPRRVPRGIGSTRVNASSRHGSRYNTVLRVRRAGLYQAFVYVGSGAQVSNHSRPVLVG